MTLCLISTKIKEMNKTALWVITILIIIGVGFVLWMNPLSGERVTTYKDKTPEGVLADFPADPNIKEVLRNQKVSANNETEFAYSYTTTKELKEILTDVVNYALSKNLADIQNGDGIDENGNDYFYFIAQNEAKTEILSVSISVVPNSNDGRLRVDVSIFEK